MPRLTLQNWSGRYAAVPGTRQNDDVPFRCPFFLPVVTCWAQFNDVPFSLATSLCHRVELRPFVQSLRGLFYTVHHLSVKLEQTFGHPPRGGVLVREATATNRRSLEGNVSDVRPAAVNII